MSQMSRVGNKSCRSKLCQNGTLVPSHKDWSKSQDIKMSKLGYISFPKTMELYQILYLLGLSEKNYNLQSLWITLYLANRTATIKWALLKMQGDLDRKIFHLGFWIVPDPGFCFHINNFCTIHNLWKLKSKQGLFSIFAFVTSKLLFGRDTSWLSSN